MDLELVLLMVAAVVGIVVGTAHMLGYVPPRYRRMLKEVQKETGDVLRASVSGAFGALDRRLEALDARLGEFLAPDGPESASPLDSLPARLESLQEAITHVPASIGAEVKSALVQAQQDFAAEMTKPFAEGLASPEQAGLAFGTDAAADKKLSRGLKAAVGADALGPYGAILEQFAPTTYDWLKEHPSEIIWALQQPWVQSIIKRGAELMGNVTQGRGGVEEALGRVVR